MNNLGWKSCASAKINDSFISIQSYSGYSLALIDPNVSELLLETNVTDEELGLAIIKGLKQSRCLSIEEARELRLNVEKNYFDWVEKKMILYGYKTKRSLFRNMKNCSVEVSEGVITIRPSHHEKLEAWSGQGISEKDYVKVSESSHPAAIGEALRLAFSRCTDRSI